MFPTFVGDEELSCLHMKFLGRLIRISVVAVLDLEFTRAYDAAQNLG
jgi:hypothetical protein